MHNKPIPFLAKNLTLAGVKHGFFGSTGGVSSGIYSALNCGYGSDDLPQNVDENRSLVAGHFGIERENLIGPYQIHSNICVIIDAPPETAPKADAYVTNVPNLALGILTADCAPILFYDAATKTIGAAHAGWQGAINGIIEATIGKMTELSGSVPQNIIAAIGPCIGKDSYEVGQEYFERFIGEAQENELFFTPINSKNEKYLFDLKSYCAAKLKACGVKNIEILPHDTCALEDDFFSNRRRNQRGEPDYGRNISTIMLA